MKNTIIIMLASLVAVPLLAQVQDPSAVLQLNSTVVLGNDAIKITALKGDVGIGTESPTAPLHVTPEEGVVEPEHNGIFIYNPNNSNNNDAILTLKVAGTSADNPYYLL